MIMNHALSFLSLKYHVHSNAPTRQYLPQETPLIDDLRIVCDQNVVYKLQRTNIYIFNYMSF